MLAKLMIDNINSPLRKAMPKLRALSSLLLLRLLVRSFAWLALTLIGCSDPGVQAGYDGDVGYSDADIPETDQEIEADLEVDAPVPLPLAQGLVDFSFGNRGVVLDQGASGGRVHVYGYDIKVNSEGDYIVAGETFTEEGAQDVAIWKYFSDGTPDSSFGDNGLVVGHGYGGGLQDNAWDMALDSAGRIVVAGRTQDPSLQYDMFVGRYLPNGELNLGFNGTGYQTHNNAAGANGYDSGYAIALDSMGRAIVAGGSMGLSEGGDGIDGPMNSDLAVWVFNDDGQFDRSFGSNHNGIFVHSDALGVNAAERATCVTTDADGRILLAGYGRDPDGLSHIPVWRLTSDGRLDESFSDDGFLVERNLAGVVNNDSAGEIAVDPSGKIWVLGLTNNAAGNADAVILRYNDDGSRESLEVLDNIAGGRSHDAAGALVFDANGNAVIGGVSVDAEGRAVVFLARYTPAGNIDRSFGPNGNGFLIANQDYSRECRLISLALDSDGIGLVGAGYCLNEDGYNDMAIWSFR